MIGRKPSTLRSWASQTPPRGPRPVKTGPTQQARTFYPVVEIPDWLADPVAYEARRRPPNAPVADITSDEARMSPRTALGGGGARS